MKSRAVGLERAPWRPYASSFAIFLVGTAVTYAGDRLLRTAMPWPLVSLIIVGAVAAVSGSRPALLVLILSALFSDLIVPDLHISYFLVPGEQGDQHHLRTVLFSICGCATIWLTHYARTMQASAERRREVVSTLQQMILPASLATIPGVDVAALYWPARTEEDVGGDFYDCFAVGGGKFCVIIGDVVGKGKEAAASTAMLRYSCRSFASLGLGPGEILGRLARMVESQQVRFGTATLFIALIEPSAWLLRYSAAGHEPPIMVAADGSESGLDAGGPMLGIGIDATYDEACVRLSAGDAVLMVTDGVTEARNRRGVFLTSDGAAAMLRESLSLPTADAALSRFSDDLLCYIDGPARDDIAALLLRVN